MLVALLLLALLFSEWRTIHYQLWGERSVSPVDLVFLSGLGWFYYKVAREEGCFCSLKPIATLWYLLLTVTSMLLLYSDQLALSNVPPSFSRFSLVGLTVYMLATALLLSNVSRERLLIYLLGLVLAVLVFYVFVFIFTRFIYWKPVIYGEGTPETGWTPALNFPFGSPSHAGMFLLLNLVLGVGAALALKRYHLLYLMIPVLVLCIFQTGSRSLAVLLAVGAVGFYSLILLRGWMTKNHPWREMMHLLLSSAVAAILLFATLDSQGERALSLFGCSPLQIVFGEVDNYRANAWCLVYESATVLPAGLSGAAGMHNAYLDLWLNWGKLSTVSFVVFLLAILWLAARLLWNSRDEAHYPLYVALVIGVVAVIGAIYANPLIHLKFIWVFFGLIVSLQLSVVAMRKFGETS